MLACHALACHALYSNTKPFALAFIHLLARQHIIRFLARLAQLARFVLATSLLRGWEPPNPADLRSVVRLLVQPPNSKSQHSSAAIFWAAAPCWVPLATTWALHNSSGGEPVRVAEGLASETIGVYDQAAWDAITRQGTA